MNLFTPTTLWRRSLSPCHGRLLIGLSLMRRLPIRASGCRFCPVTTGTRRRWKNDGRNRTNGKSGEEGGTVREADRVDADGGESAPTPSPARERREKCPCVRRECPRCRGSSIFYPPPIAKSQWDCRGLILLHANLLPASTWLFLFCAPCESTLPRWRLFFSFAWPRALRTPSSEDCAEGDLIFRPSTSQPR